MIFVTVGTHEQPFNRLVKCIDELKGTGMIQEEVIIQTGYSTYEPEHCSWSKLFSYAEMEKNVAAARIIITHGGPSSFLLPLQMGKIPIVVPRQKQFKEHVNDHQVAFCKAVAERMGTIIVIESINKLKNVILDYENIVASMPAELKSNNARFNAEFEKIVNSCMMRKQEKQSFSKI